ncbi:DUF2061 domain-containing protein [Gammaproteobacteria bacterium]
MLLVTPLVAQPAGSENLTPTHDTFSGLPSTERAVFKTASFQTAANLSDTLVFGAIIGATATTGALFLLANTASAVAVYFPYELAWDTFGPPQEATTGKTIAVKTAVYQVITGVRNLGLSYAFSGALLPSTSFVVAAMVVDAVIYVANEYAWDVLSPRTSSPASSTTP